jgi:hypothetical protein
MQGLESQFRFQSPYRTTLDEHFFEPKSTEFPG